jgi:hypothetical protein
MMEITRTITHNELSVTITARSEAAFDLYVERVLLTRLCKMITGAEYSLDNWWTFDMQALNQFVPAINRTVSITGLPMQWPTATSPDAELCVGYEYLKQMPLPIWEGWLELITDANSAPGDPDLFPPESLTDKQKKAKS